VTTTNATTGASAATPPTAPVVSAPESPSTTTSSVTTSIVTTSNATTGTSAANSQPSAPPSIPLIQFQDVPITTAIENLARQAGINYLIDPKIGYGQPDQNGQIKPEPTLSIRWENVTAGQALMALLDNYGLQLSEDRKTQIARITAKDPTAPLPLSTRVVQLKYASTSNMVDAVQAALTDKRSRVIPDTRTSQIIVVATENEQEAVFDLINELDKPTRQVLIETKLVEISSNPSTAKGIDWSGTLAAQHVTFGNGFMSGNTAATIPGTPRTTTTGGTTTPGTPGSTTTITIPGDSSHLPTTTTVTIPATAGTTTPGTSTTTTPGSTVQSILNIAQGNGGLSYNTLSGLTPAIGFLNADGASAVLSFLNAAYDAQVISTPRIVTLDNQTATIEVTRGYPVINMSGGTQNSAGSSSVTYSNVGTILQVTPRISANDYIWLRVIPVVSSHFGDEIITVQGGSGNPSTSYSVPIFDNRRIDSQVMIPDGNTLVMGGLIQDNPTASYTKVPLLGDIPGLGWAFRSESKSMIKDNLIIFLTPSIIKNSDFQPTTSAPADYLQSKPAVMKNRMNPHSVWDGAEPRGDWSNPAPIPGEFDKK
jgi:type II secretory pathway component GspD/PulD (secretin)